MMAASDTKKNTKQRKHARMGTVNLIFKIFMVSKMQDSLNSKINKREVQIRCGGGGGGGGGGKKNRNIINRGTFILHLRVSWFKVNLCNI